MSASEEQIYMFGLHLGWAAAECNLYEQGKIAKSTVTSTFTRIGQDKDLRDISKSAVYQTIEQSSELPNVGKHLNPGKPASDGYRINRVLTWSMNGMNSTKQQL
ncbi:hypothetical protein [Synechococcus sp. CC9616]|uniref:hypothetical protein n=1 Tax=Synechococcus sp. CC9616 TaxID=110663 RepID=UPI0012EBACF0|nr:hypothetical protein [Synechococcus sp. CC9616]